jgi:predicted ATPase
LTLRGFKTIRELKDFEPGRVTMLIGANGAGKSNLLSFFRMLSRALTPPGELQRYVGEQGGASALLHDGPQVTREIEAALVGQTESGGAEYDFTLSHAAGDTLIFAHEGFSYRDIPRADLGAGQREARVILAAGYSPHGLFTILRGMVVYQFRDTSATSRMRNKWVADDGSPLKEDGANLAPFLLRLKNYLPNYYQRIVGTLRLVLPFFGDFEFQIEYGHLLLRWREGGSDTVFNASQASDGMLRSMALVALLQQPERELPHVLILDEPELGLHPDAIEILAALIQSASYHCQVIVATQSVSLVDRFEPHDIVVVDRVGRESTFRRLNDADLAEWRERYTMSELWEKNVLGGTP